MSKDFWSHENIVMLIQLYESHKLLWDTTDNDYKNRYKRKDAYTSIATELGVNNVDEVKKKIESLLVQYRREKKAITPKSGMGTSDKKKAWWGLHYFQFLGDKRTPRTTVSSMIEELISEIPEPLSDNEKVAFSSGIPSPMDSTTSRSSTLLKSASGTQGSRSGSGISKRGGKRRQVDDAYNIMKTSVHHIHHLHKKTKEIENKVEYLNISIDSPDDEDDRYDLQEEITKKKFKKNETQEYDDAGHTISKPPQDFQIFGDFVAAELRNLKSKEYQRQLKLAIQRAIIQFVELDGAHCSTKGVQTELDNYPEPFLREYKIESGTE